MGIINSSIKQHGPFQVELKNHYPLNLDHLNSFTLNVYLLSPFSLDIQDSTYPRSEILADTHIYTRYTIYDMSLEDLIRRENIRSPLVRLEELLNQKRTESEEEKRKILYEFRVLANTFLELMDVREVHFRNLVIQRERIHSLKEEIVLFYELMETFLDRFRGMVMPGEGDINRKEISDAFMLTDEIISLTIERVLLPLLSLFNDAEGAKGKKRIRLLIERESEYRKMKGYAHLGGENFAEKDRERMVYRESILKKWAHSVNYMDKKRSSLNKNTGHFLAALAAAVAMAFAVLATLYANRFFVTYSLPWIVIAVFSYSLKDRIKEGLRAIFKKLIPLWISDRTDNLYDNLLKRPVGRARLTVEHIKSDDLPPAIEKVYRRGENAFRSILPQENILHMRRKITIRGKRLRRHHVRLNSLTEVFRFNLSRYVRNMDDPEKNIWYLNKGEPAEISASRVYRLKFAVCLSRKNGEETYFFYRVHMRQDGILRIEEKKGRG